MNEWIAIGALGLVALLIPVGMMAVSYLLRPSVPETSKRTTYESGEVPTGGTRIRFNIQYYMVALLFVVFDVETVLLFPWALVYLDAVEVYGMAHALAPMLLFVGILLVALAWAWRNGIVQWAKSPSPPIGRSGRMGGGSTQSQSTATTASNSREVENS